MPVIKLACSTTRAKSPITYSTKVLRLYDSINIDLAPFLGTYGKYLDKGDG